MQPELLRQGPVQVQEPQEPGLARGPVFPEQTRERVPVRALRPEVASRAPLAAGWVQSNRWQAEPGQVRQHRVSRD